MIIIIFIYGLVLGSFFNVIGLRVPLKKPVFIASSACANCHHPLPFYDMFPVFSFILLKGRCRFCHKKISPIYVIGELLTGMLFVFAYMKIGFTFELIVVWTLISLFIILFVSDVTYMIIPNKILIVFLVIFVCERIVYPLSPWWDSVLGAICMYVLLMVIFIFSKGGIGGGDIKLFALLGLALGLKVTFLSLLASIFIGAIVGIIGIYTGFFRKEEPIPFVPFIAVGTLIAYFYHKEILDLYFSNFQ